MGYVYAAMAMLFIHNTESCRCFRNGTRGRLLLSSETKTWAALALVEDSVDSLEEDIAKDREADT